MKLQVDLVRNVVFSGLANVSGGFLLLLLVLAARYLEPHAFGQFAFALALVETLALLSDLGLSELTKRSVARRPETADRFVGNVLVYRTLLALLAYGASVGVIHLLKSDPQIHVAVYVLGFGAVLKSAKTIMLTFFQALERFDLHAVSQTIHNGLALLCGFIALELGAGLIEFVVVFVAVKMVDLSVALVLLHRRVLQILPKFNVRFLRALQKAALPFAVFVVVTELYAYADTLILGMFRPATEVGWYNAAYKLYQALMILPIIFYQALSPHLSRLYPDQLGEHQKTAARSVKALVILAIPVVAGGLFLADMAIPLVFGGDYVDAVPAMQILFVGFLFMTCNWLLQALLISVDEERALSYLKGGALVLNVGLNFLLIPRFGYLGAAATLVISVLFAFAAGIILLHRRHSHLNLVRSLVGPAAVAVLSGLGAIGVVAAGVDTVPALLLFLFAFTAFLPLFNIINMRECRQLWAKVTELG